MAFEVLDPTNGPARPTTLAPRLREGLRGGRVGVIWNGRPHGDAVLRAIIDELSETHDVELVGFEKKPLIGNSAPDEIFEGLIAAPIDYVLAGVGD